MVPVGEDVVQQIHLVDNGGLQRRRIRPGKRVTVVPCVLHICHYRFPSSAQVSIGVACPLRS